MKHFMNYEAKAREHVRGKYEKFINIPASSREEFYFFVCKEESSRVIIFHDDEDRRTKKKRGEEKKRKYIATISRTVKDLEEMCNCVQFMEWNSSDFHS